LTSIKTCAGDTTSTRCMPSTRFAYSDGGNEAYSTASTFNLATSTLYVPAAFGQTPTQRFGTKGVLTGDFNGDGKTDIIRWSANPAENQLYLSNGDGTFTLSSNFNILSDVLFSGNSCIQTIAKDFNGNGLVDILRYSSPEYTPDGKTNCSAANPPSSYLFVNNGDGTFIKRSLTGVALNSYTADNVSINDPNGYDTIWALGRNFYLLDFDGDGKLDIITTKRPARAYTASTTKPPFTDLCAAVVCTQVYKGDGQGGFTEVATNLTHFSLYGQHTLGGETFDADRDGLPDIPVTNLLPSTAFNLVRSRGDGNFDLVVTPGDYAFYGGGQMPIDYNGDGQQDFLRPTGTNAGLYTMDQGVGGFTKVNTFNVTNLSDAGGGRTGASVADFNGDGRQDILRFIGTPTATNEVYLSNGNGSFTKSTTFNLTATNLRLVNSYDVATTTFVMGDFTGKGNPEFLVMGATNTLYVKTTPAKPDQLTSVTSESGAVTSLTYVPLANPVLPGDPLGRRYTSDLGTANAATGTKQDLAPAAHVVATMETDNGVGTASKAEYSYFGLKNDTAGRENLGFRAVRMQTPTQSGALHTTETTHLQSFPYIGMTASETIYRSSLNAISSSNQLAATTRVYCDQTAPAGADAAAIASGQPCTSPAIIKRPYLVLSTSTAKDLSGNQLPTTTTTTAVNANGDPTSVSATTTLTNSASDTYTKITTNLYWPDDLACSNVQTCNWILGRLKQTSTRGVAPSSILTTSAGTAVGASATHGTGTTPPLNPAALNVILQLLLDD